MDSFTDVFQAMILREFFLEPRLAQEFNAARVLSWLGRKLARPLAKVVAGKFGVPPQVVEIPARAIVGERFMTLPVRAAADILAWFKSADDNYRSCCHSALCYAVTGSHEWAFGALRKAASKRDDWARHHHIYGLIHGMTGTHERCLFELEKARSAEPHEDVRTRIAEATELCRAAQTALTQEVAAPGVLATLLSHLPEAIRLTVELIGTVRTDPGDKGGAT
jgi:hypothetical protein